MLNVIFDFDSTLVKNESFNDVLKLALNGDKDKIKQVDEVVDKSMNGLITTKESMDFRLQIASLNKGMMEQVIDETEITDGMLNFVSSLTNRANVYIVSGGFKEMIVPIAKKFGIEEQNVYANEFIYDDDKIIGAKQGILLEPQGKCKVIDGLKLQGKKVMVGDGWTDLETYLHKSVDVFVAFYGVIKRDKVDAKAEIKANNVKELSSIIDNL
ncbi:MAG: HAD-IB family phosphatase [Rickettsiales bacterium]|jgi:D-3-phosphoglycerate dehydrogenase|nr:HAD-IB family phosphatase [Rickettsiales bacterium]